jgi:outer membrane protein TolC
MRTFRCILSIGAIFALAALVRGQEPLPKPTPAYTGPVPVPAAAPADRPFPITLPTALALAQVEPIDIQIAQQRLQQALAQEERASALWLPNVYLGVGYNRHDGQLQDVVGDVFSTSKQSLMVGAGPTAVFAFTDALYGPLAARQNLAAQRAGIQTAANDVMVAVTDSYFGVQQARGEWAAAQDAVTRAEELVRRTEKLAAGLISPVEAARARTELARRRQSVSSARERWRVSSARLTRLLRLDALARVEPLEPPDLKWTMVKADEKIDDLVPLALTNRPELATQQALVQATLTRLKQEKMRPLIPSLLFRGTATPHGTLMGGVFGGGLNSDMSDFRMRNTFDVQLAWELQNLGFGNAARQRERLAENRVAALELLQIQDRVAADVVEAHAQLQEAAARIVDAEAGLKDAKESADKNLEGLNQTRRVGEVLLLIIRPQEVVAANQALQQALNDYYGAVADYDRAQFRLHRALGRPPQAITEP